MPSNLVKTPQKAKRPAIEEITLPKRRLTLLNTSHVTPLFSIDPRGDHPEFLAKMQIFNEFTIFPLPFIPFFSLILVCICFLLLYKTHKSIHMLEAFSTHGGDSVHAGREADAQPTDHAAIAFIGLSNPSRTSALDLTNPSPTQKCFNSRCIPKL